MSKKERDIWDDAIRSKLEDFEMDTLPGDWEAIASDCPERLRFLCVVRFATGLPPP